MSGTDHKRTGVGSLNAAVANAVVHLINEHTGRGPTQARAHFSDDLITVVLRDTLIKGERSLVRDGRADLVLTTRRAFQSSMREDLVSEVERITGRKVDAFLSDNHIDPDIAVETFVLESLHPRGAADD